MAQWVDARAKVIVDPELLERRDAAEREFNQASWAYFNGLGKNDEFIRRGTPTGQASSRLADIEKEMRRIGSRLRSLNIQIRIASGKAGLAR